MHIKFCLFIQRKKFDLNIKNNRRQTDDEWIRLKWVSKKQDGRIWTGLYWAASVGHISVPNYFFVICSRSADSKCRGPSSNVRRHVL